MAHADLIAALLLPLPPWLGFWIFRRKGRIGLSYGYFLGGILALLALPWTRLTGIPVPTPQLGGALFGFTLFLQAQREGAPGIRRLVVGVGGATGFLLLLLVRLHLPWQEVPLFWVVAALEMVLWLLFSDLAYRLAKGRQLEVRMPLVGSLAMGMGTLAQLLWPDGQPRLSLAAALISGLLLGLVALQQLRWLREQGAWVEGRGEGIRTALALLEKDTPDPGVSLSLGLEAQQPVWLVDAKGRILESNGPLSRLTGLPRHRLRGFDLNAIFQGGDTPVWEGMQGQLLRYGCASLQATQVSDDGTFRSVALEASSFDRGMALVWIRESTPGAIRLGGGGTLQPLGDEQERRQRANALIALSVAARGFASAAGGVAGEGMDQLRTALLRLDPSLASRPERVELEGRSSLEGLLPRLLALLPPGGQIALRAEALPLPVEVDTLHRLATHLVLHALEHAPAVPLTLTLEAVDLGTRAFGLLQVVPDTTGKTKVAKTIFGLAWLRQAVQEAGGLLALDQEETLGLWPRVYLPTVMPLGSTPARATLAGRTIWIVDQDPLAREAMAALVRTQQDQVCVFESLPELLRSSRTGPAPDALVLERTPRLERFHRSLRAFQKEPLPTLVIGMGQPLPVNPGSLGLRRLGFLERPFAPDAFFEALQALLHQPERPGPRLL